MNFLSHYYFDHKDNDPYYNFGLLLPDLTRNFVPGSRVFPLTGHQFYNEQLRLNQGCERHVNSDKIFHSWEGFEDLMHQVKTEFRKDENIRPERDWFVAHIFVELMIDHHLLNRFPELASDLYNSYQKLNTPEVLVYLDNFGLNSAQKQRFGNGFDRFMDARYLESYARPESIIYALERICNKMGISAFSEGQKGYYMEIISKLERNIVQATTELQSLLR